MACITKRRNRWVIDFYDQFGKRRWKTLPKDTSKAKAREGLRRIEDIIAKGICLPNRKAPLFCEIAEDWLEYKKLNIRETTWEVYEGHVKNHFQEINGSKINMITTATIENFINARQKEGMNISTLRKILVTLGQIIAYAVRHKYIDYNPVREAERPRNQGHEAKDIRVINPTQIQELLSKVENQKYRTLFMLAIMSGARQGELLGLKWSDIDLTNNQIRIQRTFNGGRFFDTKTKTSRRKIDLGPKIMLELKKWKLACPSNELDLIFPNEVGKPINCSNMVHRYFHTALEASGLPRMRFHDLRHTYASLLIEQGENMKYVQSQLGHSSPMVTLTVYAHLMKSVNQEAACRLESTIFQEPDSKMVAESKKGITNVPITP